MDMDTDRSTIRHGRARARTQGPRPPRLLSAIAAGLLGTCGAVAAAPATATAQPAGGAPAAVLASMSLAQQVGQLFMVGGPATGVGADTVSAVRDRHVGSVIL